MVSLGNVVCEGVPHAAAVPMQYPTIQVTIVEPDTKRQIRVLYAHRHWRS
jgi:hypothetical protein